MTYNYAYVSIVMLSMFFAVYKIMSPTVSVAWTSGC